MSVIIMSNPIWGTTDELGIYVSNMSTEYTPDKNELQDGDGEIGVGMAFLKDRIVI